MNNIPRLGILAALLILVFAASAQADTMNYTASGSGVSATFSITQNPSFTGSASSAIIVPVSGLDVYGQTITSLDLFSSSSGGGLGAILNLGGGPQLFQLTGPQLYSYASGVVTLLSGKFNLSDGFTLTAVDPPGTAAPEPASLLLLASGLAGLGLLRKRAVSN